MSKNTAVPAASNTPAPPRNKFQKRPANAQATVGLLSQAPPGKVRQWVELRDESHPQHVSRYLQEETITVRDEHGEVHWATRAPWQVVCNDGSVKGRYADDNGKAMDTLVRHRSMVLIETDDDNYRVYQERKAIRDRAMNARLRNGHEKSAGASITTRVVSSRDGFVDNSSVLKE